MQALKKIIGLVILVFIFPASWAQDNKDSTVVKNLTWHIDKRFQIVTKINKAGQPEKITTTVISWQ